MATELEPPAAGAVQGAAPLEAEEDEEHWLYGGRYRRAAGGFPASSLYFAPPEPYSSLKTRLKLLGRCFPALVPGPGVRASHGSRAAGLCFLLAEIYPGESLGVSPPCHSVTRFVPQLSLLPSAPLTLLLVIVVVSADDTTGKQEDGPISG